MNPERDEAFRLIVELADVLQLPATFISDETLYQCVKLVDLGLDPLLVAKVVKDIQAEMNAGLAVNI